MVRCSASQLAVVMTYVRHCCCACLTLSCEFTQLLLSKNGHLTPSNGPCHSWCHVLEHPTIGIRKPCSCEMVEKDAMHAHAWWSEGGIACGLFCVRSARVMCMACIIPLTSAAGLCAFGHLQHACVQMSWLIRMGYTWHYNAIKHTHATWHTHVIHMSFTCHSHVIHM